MSLDKWPCIPESFASILPGDLPFFIQTGANHALGRAVSIIDPNESRRIDAIDRFDSFQPFCRSLRVADLEPPTTTDWDNHCTQCDLIVARYLMKKAELTSGRELPLLRYRCYMGLEELATAIEVGGFRVMVVSGQFKPPEGSNDISAAVASLGRKPLRQTEVSDAMQASMARFQWPDHLWLGENISEEQRRTLLKNAEILQLPPKNFAENFHHEVERIADIARNYYDMAKARLESHILEDVAKAISKIVPYNSANFWTEIEEVLSVLRTAIDVEYVALFCGTSEIDTILTLKAKTGVLPAAASAIPFPHFNWRKAGLKTLDERDTREQYLEWMVTPLMDQEFVNRGFKGGANPFSSIGGLVPVRLPGGPSALLVIGQHPVAGMLRKNEAFVLTACRELATRILTLQLFQILQADRSDWRRTSQLTGHRVRASLQNINSQLRVIRSCQAGESDFTSRDKDLAERDLKIAFRDLTEVSYAAESNIRGALDVRSASREWVPLGNIVWAAVAAQQDEADKNGIKIEVAEDIAKLPSVWVNQTLMRSVFINLVNNGLKYSYPKPFSKDRVLYIECERFQPGEAGVRIVNFGMGIRETEREKIFEWGVRLAGTQPTFREVYGKGIGLWEVKHIVEGHGGRVYADSTHYSKSPITDQNIQQCVTAFVVILPTALDQREPQGG